MWQKFRGWLPGCQASAVDAPGHGDPPRVPDLEARKTHFPRVPEIEALDRTLKGCGLVRKRREPSSQERGCHSVSLRSDLNPQHPGGRDSPIDTVNQRFPPGLPGVDVPCPIRLHRPGGTLKAKSPVSSGFTRGIECQPGSLLQQDRRRGCR